MFFEAIMYGSSDSEGLIWHDRSTAHDFIFESDKGVVKLQKRTAYPQTAAYANEGVLVVGYGNIELGRQIAHSNLDRVDEALFYTDEFLYVELDLRTGRVLLQRDALSTLPIFAASQSDRVILTSRHSRTIELVGKEQISVDHVTLVRYLCGLDNSYGTLFKDMTALHDRMRFRWKNGSSQLEFAPHAVVKDSITRRDGSIRDLRQQLERTLDTYKERYAPGDAVACEWSGGIDSALVTAYLVDKGYEVATATMMLPGADGALQLTKLGDFTRRFHIVESLTFQLDPDRHYLFHEAHQTNTWKPLYFWEQTVLNTVRRQFLQELRDRGFAYIFTGDGGDELCEENDNPYARGSHDLSNPFKRFGGKPPIWWTAAMQAYLDSTVDAAAKRRPKTLPLLSPSAALGGICGGNDYIEQGFWLARPLSDPRLYAYCQSLPLRYRVNKNMLKMYLEARKTPSSILKGENKDFSEFYFTATSRRLGAILDIFLANSVLDAAGLIDKHAVRQLYKEFAARPFSFENWRALYDIERLATIEVSLQTAGVRSL